MDEWICYLIVSGNHTYVGVTKNITRRLRQHNKVISGGSKCTSSHDNWEVHMVVSGFESKSAAMSFEWHWKRFSKSYSGTAIDRRMTALDRLMIDNPHCHIKKMM